MPKGGIGAKWGAAVGGASRSRGQTGYKGATDGKTAVRGHVRAKRTTMVSGAHGRKPMPSVKTGYSTIQPVGRTYAAKKGMKVSAAYGRKGH